MNLYDYVNKTLKYQGAPTERAPSAGSSPGADAKRALDVAKHLADASQAAAGAEIIPLKAQPVAN